MIDYQNKEFIEVIQDRDKGKKLYDDFKRLARERREYIQFLFKFWGEEDYQSIVVKENLSRSIAYEVCAKKVKTSFLL